MSIATRLHTIAWRTLGALAALLVMAGAAQAQRPFTSSSGGGGLGDLIVRTVYGTLRACQPGDAGADGCSMGAGPANAGDAVAYATAFGTSRGELWTYLADAAAGLSQPVLTAEFFGPAAAAARINVLTSFRHNLIMAIDGTWADPAQGGADTPWTAYFIYRDVQAEDSVDPVNPGPLAPQTFGASLVGHDQRLLVSFFDLLGDPYIDADGGLVQDVGLSAGLRLRSVSTYFFDVATAAPGDVPLPEPGTLLLVGAAVAAAAAQRRRRRRRRVSR